jgi:hypothetical protein
VVQGYGHAEAAASAALLDRIGRWARQAATAADGARAAGQLLG